MTLTAHPEARPPDPLVVAAWCSAPERALVTLGIRLGVRADDQHQARSAEPCSEQDGEPADSLIEALCQAMRRAFGTDSLRQPLLRSFGSIRDLSPLLPGDQLGLAVTGRRRAAGGWTVQIDASRLAAGCTARILADVSVGAGGRADR